MINANLVFWEIDGLLRGRLARDRLNQQAGASDEVLVIDCETGLIVGECDVVRAQHGQSSDARLAERGVPDREHGVAETEHVAHDAFVWLVKEVGLAAFGVDVGVRAQEGREDADCVPPHEHLGLRVAEEATNVGW